MVSDGTLSTTAAHQIQSSASLNGCHLLFSVESTYLDPDRGQTAWIRIALVLLSSILYIVVVFGWLDQLVIKMAIFCRFLKNEALMGLVHFGYPNLDRIKTNKLKNSIVQMFVGLKFWQKLNI